MRLGDFRGALKVAEQSGRHRSRPPRTQPALSGRFLLGGAYHYIGDQAAAQLYCERGLALAVELGTSVPNFLGFDHRICAPVGLTRALWLRGFADRARSIAKTAIDEAASGVHPISICVSLAYASTVFLWSGDLRSVSDLYDQLIEYAGRHSIEPYRARRPWA